MHPLLQDMLQETFGVIIYQEQVMEIARILAGYSLGDADLLRRAMGKKNRKEMAEQQQRFLDGAANNNIEPELAKIIFQRVEKFAGYGFNKSHAAAYALISYQTAYLKTHYPQAFMAATMTYDRHNIEKIAFLADEAKKEGIKLLAPSIDKSVVEFNLESINDDDGRQVTAIRHSLVAIKGMGENVAETIINKRQAGIWASFEDMVHDVTPQVINKKSLEGLIYGGACDLFGNNRSTLITNIENVFASYASKQNSSSLFGDELSVTTTLKEETEFVDSDKLLHEKNVIGFYVSSHPLDKYRAIIQDLGVSHIKDITPESTGFYQLCAIINNKRERRAESGKRYAFLSCADNTGVIDISIFSEVLEKNRQLLEDQSKVLILSVDIQLKEGRQRLTLQQVKDIDQYILENRTAVSLHLADDFTSFTELRHVINGWQQGCKNISIYYKGYKFGISNKYDITIKCLQDCTSLGVKYLVE
jgi:DNA polymerase-3 subunit alpha